jgi:hypothetical protein
MNIELIAIPIQNGEIDNKQIGRIFAHIKKKTRN